MINTDTNTGAAERLVTDKTMAEAIQASRRHIHVLRARGLLRAVKIGGMLRFPLNENLRRLLNEGGETR